VVSSKVAMEDVDEEEEYLDAERKRESMKRESD
jgi:hypothetical protein